MGIGPILLSPMCSVLSAMSRHNLVLRRRARRTFRVMATSLRNVGPSANSDLYCVTLRFVYDCQHWLATASELTACILNANVLERVSCQVNREIQLD